MTIVGIGVDLVEVVRFGQVIERQGDVFLQRIFTTDELAYCAPMRRPAAHYAARFAAKEAVAKALGTGIGAEATWQEIEVRRSPEGRPSIRLHGATAQYAASRGVAEIHLSLSHTETTAIAYVILAGA